MNIRTSITKEQIKIERKSMNRFVEERKKEFSQIKNVKHSVLNVIKRKKKGTNE